MDSDAALAQLLAVQQGLILRRQARDLGLTDRAIAWRIAQGDWRRVFPGLYATFAGAPTEEQRLIAATLYGGPGTQITGVAALRWHGLRYLPDEPWVHVLKPGGCWKDSRGFVVVTRTKRPDSYPVLRPAFEVCSLARAGADAARAGYSRRDVRAFLAEMVQRRRVTLEQLDAELRNGAVRGSKLLRRVLDEVRDGVGSAPEAELRELTGRSRILPPIRWNPVLVAADGTPLPSPDGWIEEVGLALEMDSDEFHTSLDDLRRTRDRHNRLATCGILTLHFSPWEIRHEPRRVLATIEAAYRGRPAGFTGVLLATAL
ncbi:type IV toxin-antitoxin system AbiEi family antitoxin domain-containing protein [Cryptosporangium minutisporangium]|uniref:AbiEi antitoxin N-terminal domain-containing protein n=1 Tax=Cryptosporangium minutisporangium TaxID=113569 RepID=A0ABP6STG1_9ACTN